MPYTKLAISCYEHCEITVTEHYYEHMVLNYVHTYLNTTELNKTEPSRGTGNLVFDESNIFQTQTTYFLHSSSHLIYNNTVL